MERNRLPIQAIIPQLVTAIRAGSNVVLTAPTGSGKTTQVPQALLDRFSDKRIIVVQPRRLACRAVAMRVAAERGTSLGGEVGYVVRHDSKASPASRLLFVTDGVLLRFLEEDPGLRRADIVVFDEFHERRATMDLALGLLKLNQKRQRKPTFIIMSATMETERVSEYLNAVTLSAKGRAFPVSIRHELAKTQEEALQALPALVSQAHHERKPGHILVFLSGKREIFQAQQLLERVRRPGLNILPLHGELPTEEQDRVFQPTKDRNVVLATNVAETSLTIPGVTTVIDTGFERLSAFDADLRINTLRLVRVSKASANQRSGRAGRESEGRCIRLWSEQTHDQLLDRRDPEIMTTDLASVVLTLKANGIMQPERFDFLDQPDMEQLRLAEAFLTRIAAVDDRGELTPVGWRMHHLPLPPRYARMVVEGEHHGCLFEMATVAAFMSGRPIFSGERYVPSSGRSTVSDFFNLIELYHNFRADKEEETRAWCEERDINTDAFQEAAILRRKIVTIALDRGSLFNRRPAAIEIVQRCLLSGLVDRFAKRMPSGEYQLPNGTLCHARDGASTADWIAAAAVHQLKRGEANILSILTIVPPELVQEFAPHLLRTTPDTLRVSTSIADKLIVQKPSDDAARMTSALPPDLSRRLQQLSPIVSKLLGGSR